MTAFLMHPSGSLRVGGGGGLRIFIFIFFFTLFRLFNKLEIILCEVKYFTVKDEKIDRIHRNIITDL